MKRKALKYAFPYTLPICAGFLFLGMSYGFFASSKGFSFIYPLCMSMFIFAGSMEFVTVSLLLASFNPVYSFLLTLMVNARHLFYGISMLNTYKDYSGIKKFYLIYGMCDETFSVNCSITPATRNQPEMVYDMGNSVKPDLLGFRSYDGRGTWFSHSF